MTRGRYVLAVSFLAGLGFVACGGGGGGTDAGRDAAADGPALDAADVPMADAVDVPGTDVPGADVPGTDAADVPMADAADVSGTDAADVPAGPPCLDQVPVGKVLDLAGASGPVQVVRDKWGIPHIYASTEADAFRAQGYVTAYDRAAGIQGVRLILQGRFAASAAGGPGDVSSDAYMRLLDLYGVATQEWTDLQASDPGLAALMQAYADGISDWIQAAKDHVVTPPVEFSYLGPWDPWTPVDSLAVGRLQSWDLSFDGEIDEITMASLMQALQAKVAGTPQEGLLADAFRAQPAAPATILPPPAPTTLRAARARVPATVPAATREFVARASRLPAGYFQRLGRTLGAVHLQPVIPQGGGSNNWAVAPAHTADGKAILANDPHLALRNPAVFHLVHLDTTRAGGTLSISGASFPGIPGVILGRNAYAAWAGTVHEYDVTDVYVETFAPGDPTHVMFEGAPVAVESRQETFDYAKPAGGCDVAIDAFVAGMSPSVTEANGRCTLTLTMRKVPHHGPIIPGSDATDTEGNAIAMTWRWTGFEPTDDLQAVAGLWRMKTPQEFHDTIMRFGVGAQNWLYADVDGHIAWMPFAKVPIRKQLNAGATTPVPWLPMPGDGSCEWIGYVPIDALPQSQDPASGLIVTANNDPNGLTLDGDPLNDGPYYFSYTYDLGFRAQRATERLDAVVAGNAATVADMQAVQADHRSPMGAVMTPGILDAVQAALDARDGVEGADPALAAFATPEVETAAGYLRDWTFDAAAGVDVGSGVTDAQRSDAIATSIFDTTLVFLEQAIFPDKGLAGLPDEFKAKLLVALFQDPTVLATYDADLHDSTVWDALATPDVVETRNGVILKALSDAIAFLGDPAAVGPAEKGGFGTTDMSLWTWGSLHTLTLQSALGGEADIPPQSQWPNGFPRPGDNFVVDAANPGLSDFDFTYSHGPSQRPVYHMDGAAGVPTVNALPGGEAGSFPNAHYGDDFQLWARNQTHPVDTLDADVVADAESCLLLKAP